jgi:L-amino acid N-acyltransferase YncA
MKIEKLLPLHWMAVKEIYEEGIATGNATFQTNAPSWEEWDNSHLVHSRLVAIDNREVIGWAALTAVSDRCVYAGVAEVSVYIASSSRGKKIGQALLLELISRSEKNNIWTLQAGIFPENMASLKLHKQCGFNLVGRREKIGKMKSIWRDTILLERRSKAVGI